MIGLTPCFPASRYELDRAGERAVVGERDGGHLELGGAGRERGDPARPVEDRVLGVDVEVDEIGHGRPNLQGRSDGPQEALARRCQRSFQPSWVRPEITARPSKRPSRLRPSTWTRSQRSPSGSSRVVSFASCVSVSLTV